MDYTPRERLRLNAIALTHALTYAISLTVAAILVSFVLGIASGGGIVASKIALFLIGWLLMAYALFRLWPSDASEYRTQDPSEIRQEKANAGSDDVTPDSIPADSTESRFQQTVYSLPPVRWLPQPSPSHRLGDEVKLFLGSVFVLLSSFLMEVVFGVGVA